MVFGVNRVDVGILVVSERNNYILFVTMKMLWIYAILGILASAWIESDGANILFLTPMGSKSHTIFYMGYTNELAKRGHKITMVSAYKNKETKNVRDVIVPEIDISEMLADVFEEGGADDYIKTLVMDSPAICVKALGTKEVQDLKKENFDLVIISMFFDYCFLSLIHHFQVPFIYTSPTDLFDPFLRVMGNVEFSSLNPNKLTEASFPQTFQQRFMSLGLNLIMDCSLSWYIEPKMEKLCKEAGLCPPDMPSFREMNKNASLAIINSIKALEWPPRPMIPNVIYAGGAHIRPANNLSLEFESWIQTSGNDGFIFFSLGSAVTPSFLPEKYRKILLNVFGSLKQKVLWKWDEETMPDLPKNVKLGKWLPQQDILGHPKLKLFITHGGLLSTMESTYHGVPIIGMPIFADQFSNMREAANEGWGKLIQWNKLTESLLRDTILEVLNDKNLRAVSLQRSSLMRDRPLEPADEAAFWVEYVIRHGGARHLMSPISNMAWYELYNVDIWAIIVVFGLGFLYLIYRIVKALFGLCFRNKNKSKISRKNKKD